MLTILAILALVLLFAFLVYAAVRVSDGSFFGFWLSWNLLESAGKVLGGLVEVIAGAIGKGGE